MKRLAVLLVMAALVSGSPQPGFSQAGDDNKALRKEVEALREGQSAIQKELQELKTLLQGARLTAPRPAEPQNVLLSLEGAPSVGNPNAKVTLVEFSDYQCPFCGRHFSQTLPQLMTEYVKAGKVRYVFRDFPLESIHPQAFKAAEAARCAGDQGKYWEMHDWLFANQGALGLPDLLRHAKALALGAAKFQQCVESGTYGASVRSDQADGQKAGVSGTPTFFLGLSEPNGSQVKALRKVVGAQPYSEFKAAIDSLLGQQ